MEYDNTINDLTFEKVNASIKAGINFPTIEQVEQVRFVPMEEALGMLAIYHPDSLRARASTLAPVTPSQSTIRALMKFSIKGIHAVLSQLSSSAAVKKLSPFNVCASMDVEGYSTHLDAKSDGQLVVTFKKHRNEFACPVTNGLIDPTNISVKGLQPLQFNVVVAQVCKAFTALYSLKNGKLVVINVNQADNKILGRTTMNANYLDNLSYLADSLIDLFTVYTTAFQGKSMHGPTFANALYVMFLHMLNDQKEGKKDYVNICNFFMSPQIFTHTIARGEDGGRINTSGLWTGRLIERKTNDSIKTVLQQSFRSLPLKVPNEIEGVPIILCDNTKRTYVISDKDELIANEIDAKLEIVCNKATATLASSYRALILSRTARGENKGDKGANSRMFYNAVMTTPVMAEVSYMKSNIQSIVNVSDYDDIVAVGGGDVVLRILKCCRILKFAGTVHITTSDNVNTYLSRDDRNVVRFADSAFIVESYPSDNTLFAALINEYQKQGSDGAKLAIFDFATHHHTISDMSKFGVWQQTVSESIVSRFDTYKIFTERGAAYVTFAPLLTATPTLCKSKGLHCYSRVDPHSLVCIYSNKVMRQWWLKHRYNLSYALETENLCALSILINIMRCNENLYDFDIHGVILNLGYRFNRAGLKDLSCLTSKNIHFDTVNVDDFLRSYVSGDLDLNELPVSIAAAVQSAYFKSGTAPDDDSTDVEVFDLFTHSSGGKVKSEAQNEMEF